MPHHHQTNSQNNLTFLKSNYKFKRRDMPAIRALPATKAEARTPNQLAATMSKTSAAVATSETSDTSEAATATATKQLPSAINSECRTILSLFIVITWNFLQESLVANCWWLWLIEDDDQYGRDVNGGQDCSDEVSMAREHQQKNQNQQQQHRHRHRQEQHQPCQKQYKHEHSSSSSPMKSMRCTTTVAVAGATPAAATPSATAANTVATSVRPAATSTSGHQSQSLVGQPLMALLIGLLLLNMRLVSAGTCWQTHLGNGKCSQIFSTNMSRSECCGTRQGFSYTDRELSSVEYFFATAIGGGVECAPCMESCKGFECGPNRKCVKRKGRPKCVCAPECGAALRRKQQQQQWQQPRESRSLSSEISSINLGLDGDKRQRGISSSSSSGSGSGIADNQRIQMQHGNGNHHKKALGETKHRRLLIIDSSNLRVQPTSPNGRFSGTGGGGGGLGDGLRDRGVGVGGGRVEMRGYERRGLRNRPRNSHGKHSTRSMTTGANDKTPAQATDPILAPVPASESESATATAQLKTSSQSPSRRKLANANEPANDINRQQQQQQQSDNARFRHQHARRIVNAPHSHSQSPSHSHPSSHRNNGHRHKHRQQLKDRPNDATSSATAAAAAATAAASAVNTTLSGHLYLQHGSKNTASSDFANADDLAFLGGIYEPVLMHQQQQQQLHSNPVCGSDGRTYNTECQLRKRACRTNNAQLEVAYRGNCKTTCNGVQCLNGLTCVEDQNMTPHCIACQIECPEDDLDDDNYDAKQAVCGVDGQTYRSVCDINRMICKIGRSIAVAYPGPCRAGRVSCADIKCGPKDTCLVDFQTRMPRCVSCRYKCPRKHQRPTQKICGHNNHTYNSWCEMHQHSCESRYFIGVKSSGSC
ncbi:uncharacterized protein Fs isoform X1 [Drosophila bipectinata]|uniref:uncharacterized protein Fs isoform X1 n=1 Tax=Drosophila bipectinata TaxID=42026 RepID=UPI0038B2A0A1